MKIRIIADSSANLFELGNHDFVSVPMKVMTEEKQYVDNEELNVYEMLEDLKDYKGKTSTSCPNIGDWLESFGDADIVYGSSLTSTISGSYNAAMMAAEEYMNEFPDRNVFILDSLTTGPELELITEKYGELLEEGKGFEEICEEIQSYLKRTHLMFSLENLQNFVNNGRVNAAVAAAVKMLGICIVGQASEDGQLQPLHKRRGRNRAIRQIFECMQEAGYEGGKVRIRHSSNEESAKMLEAKIHSVYPDADIRIGENFGLCSYYAETGGVLVGFESK